MTPSQVTWVVNGDSDRMSFGSRVKSATIMGHTISEGDKVRIGTGLKLRDTTVHVRRILRADNPHNPDSRRGWLLEVTDGSNKPFLVNADRVYGHIQPALRDRSVHESEKLVSLPPTLERKARVRRWFHTPKGSEIVPTSRLVAGSW